MSITGCAALCATSTATACSSTPTRVASPGDLTAGWSYTALSRARGETRLLIHDQEERTPQRSELAPTGHTPTADRADILGRVERHMLQRDNEDLASEQLPGAGRANDPHLAEATTVQRELPQERAAALAEPAQPPMATPGRLRELSERIDQLTAQLQALPVRKLQRIEDLQDRALTLTAQREHVAQRLAALPEPTRRLGRERDPHSIERSRLTSTIENLDRALEGALAQRTQHERALGDPAEMRAERDGLKHAIRQSTREHSIVRQELAERETRELGRDMGLKHDVGLGIEL